MAEEATNKPTRRSERIGKYEILGLIATGGMGIVYKARDTKLERLVALKVLPAEIAAQPLTLERFQREAKAAARLRHENIVAIYDWDQFNGTHYIAFEFVEGTDLQAYINRKCKLDPEEARQIIIQAARALVHAHELGIVHRDVKPSNFLLTRLNKRVVVKLTDFGLAIQHENEAEFRITRDKTTVGTVDYMSPEQARDSRSVDIRSDIYSLGCTFFHMLAGNAPFARGTMPERIVQHMQTAPPDVRRINPSVPASFILILNRMLAKKPADRYQSPAELLHDLEHPEQVVPPSKPAPRVGKLEGVTPRKPEPTAVIESKDLEEESIEPRQVKRGKPKKPTPIAPALEEEDIPPETPVEQSFDARELDVPEKVDTEETDEPDATAEKRKSSVPGSPLWMYATAGSVGVLGLILVFALVFGGRGPKKEEEKPPEKKPDPPPVVVEPPEKEKEDPPPPRVIIDTTPTKMTVGLDLPSLETTTIKPNRVALRMEYLGPFTQFPEVPEKAPVWRVSRLGSAGPMSFHTLADAFAQTKQDDFVVIEIQDNGPIFVAPLPALVQRTIVLRAGAGYRPLVVWEVGPDSVVKPAATFCAIRKGKLILDNIDFVVNWPGDAPATWFDMPDTDFFARSCSFSAASKNGLPIDIVRRMGPTADNRKTQTWLQSCYVRGASVTLLHTHGVGGELMVEDSLVVGHQQPLLQLRCREKDAVSLRCIRSTLTTGQALVRWQGLIAKNARPQINGRILDSILSRHDNTTAQGDMIQLADQADPGQLDWRAANSLYAGWKQLLASSSVNIGGHDIDAWRRQLGGLGNVGSSALDAWPRGLTKIDEQPASNFLPGSSSVAYAAQTGSGAIGCVIGRLPPVPEAWRDFVGQQRDVPLVPLTESAPAIDSAADGFYHGEVLNLNKINLGDHLRGVLQARTPAARVVLHLEGKGPCATSPVRVKGIQHLVLYFKQPADASGKDALTLELAAPNPNLRQPMIEMVGGKLEVVGAQVRLSPATLVPTVVNVQNGDLTMTRCRLHGPLTPLAENFDTLVAVTNSEPWARTLLMRDNVLTSGKLLIRMTHNVQLKARNNLYFALGDAVRIDCNRPSVALVHLLDHNTFAARQSCFTLRTGPDFQAAAPAVMHANSNAFLHPFADAEAAVFLRGGETWVHSGSWSWQGRFNVYDPRWQAWFGPLDKPAAKQTLNDWKLVWGQVGEQDAIGDIGPGAKTLKADTFTLPALLAQLDCVALPRTIRGDPNQSPPGANLAELGALKKK